MKSNVHESSPTLSRQRKLLLAGMLLFVNFSVLEAGTRGILAYKVGPRVLLYGTRYYRNAPEPPRVIETTNEVASEFGGYSKYFPNEYKIDHGRETGETFQVKINSRGFRGEEFSNEKQSDTLRVVTLGASSTFGFYDRDDETYPFYLEQDLNEKASNRASYEVINLGIPHLTSDQILALFQAEALPLNPDIVTFYEGINDSSQMPDEVWQKKKEVPARNTAETLREKAAGLTLLRQAYHATRDRLLTLSLLDTLLRGTLNYNEADFESHALGKSERFLANVSAIYEMCRERGILFIVLKQQARSMMIKDVKGLSYEDEIALVRRKLDATDSITHQEKAFLTHKILGDDLEAWARSAGVPFVDVIELLDRDRDVLVSWVHLSARGNRFIAQALAEEILRHP